MRLAISNLAWPLDQDASMAALLRRHRVAGVEIAPTKVWPRPLEVSPAEVRDYRRFWQDQGLPIVALQALLFGRPDLTIFDSSEVRAATFHYLAGICRLARALGAPILVFGSPKNRAVGRQAPAEVAGIARDFFGRLADVARDLDVTFCIEPNPPAYQCDFVTRGEEGAQLVAAVGKEGFGLHLDTAAMTLAGDDVASLLAKHGRTLRHFHISEPYLAPVTGGALDHVPIATALRASGYDGWLSIEMKEGENGQTLAAVDRALGFVRRCYLGDGAD